MPTTTDSLSLIFSVSSRPYEVKVDTSTNILARRVDVLYRSKRDDDSAHLAFYSAAQPLSSSIVSITDRSSSLIGNRIVSSLEYTLAEGVAFYSLPTDKFLVTDIFADVSSTVRPIPIFFKHVLNQDLVPRISSSDLTLIPTAKLLDIQVLDKDFAVITDEEIQLDKEQGIVYNNLESSFNTITSDFEVFYVRYSVKVSNTITTYTELISNEGVFTLASFDDLDENLEIIQDGRKVYLINEEEESFFITLPIVNDYAFTLLTDARIQVTPPPILTIQEPWHVGISNGKFFADIEEQVYRYSVAEFVNQVWDPELPYKKVTDEIAEAVSKTLIKLHRTNVVQTETQFIDILISDKDNLPLEAFTTDPDKEDTIASNDILFTVWNNTDRLGIRSVDQQSGFVEIEGLDLKTNYNILATYYYEELGYEFSLVDFNPLNNSSVLDNKVSVFIDPDTNTTNKTQTVYYLLSDKAGQVVKSNWSLFNNDTQALTTGSELYYESYPSFVSPSDKELFVDLYSTEGSGIYLLLGDIEVKDYSTPNAGLLLDTRIRGGGLKDERVDPLTLLNPEIDHYWDIGQWDGQGYPGNASFFVEVPVETLEEAGGVFRTNEVKSVVDKHAALGTYGIVKAYGIDPLISGVIIGSGYINITWRSYD